MKLDVQVYDRFLITIAKYCILNICYFIICRLSIGYLFFLLIVWKTSMSSSQSKTNFLQNEHGLLELKLK